MARGRGVKKSAQKGKGKAKEPSSSPFRKSKLVDEVTSLEGLRISSPIKENISVEDLDIDDVTNVIPPPTLEERIQHSTEKTILSQWLDVIQSGSKVANTPARLSWADRVDT